jgi:hypothetical protein
MVWFSVLDSFEHIYPPLADLEPIPIIRTPETVRIDVAAAT